MLSGVISGPTTTGIWSNGSGTFTPNNTDLNATYSPTAAELTAGFVKLVLTSTGNGNCNQIRDTVRINYTNPPTANASFTSAIDLVSISIGKIIPVCKRY